MSTRYWAGLALLMTSFLVLAAGPGAVRKQVESSMLVTGSIYIEPDGSVSRFGIDKREKLPPGVVKLVDESVPGWKFEPVLVDGVPVKAKAIMNLRLVAKKLDGERYSVTIGSAAFGGEAKPGESVTTKKLTPPAFPSTAAQAGVTGTVYVVLRIGKDGQVEEAIAEQVNLRVIASEREMALWRQVLERSALGAAKKWRFNPPRSGDEAKAEFWSVRVPVDYRFDDEAPKQGQWEAYVPGPRQTAAWVEQDEMASTGADALVAGSVYQIGRGLRLLTPLGAG